MAEDEAAIRQGRIDEARRMYQIMRSTMSDSAIRAIAVHLFDAANPRVPIEEEAEVVLFPRFPPVTQSAKRPSGHAIADAYDEAARKAEN